MLSASYSTLLAPAYDADVLARALPLIGAANPKLLQSPGCFVAETTDGKLVGLGAWSFDYPGIDEPTQGVAHVRHFATHPDWIRCGIGRAIYERCERDARAAGVRVFECNAGLNAEAFYVALGFTTLRRTQVQLAPGIAIDAIAMRKNLE